jgi:hypothetical protein
MLSIILRMANSLICPITQDVIKFPVRTLAGIIYEHDAIKSWLETHSYDPVTRLMLPSKHLLPVRADDIDMSPNEFRTTLTWTICTPMYHMAVEIERKFVPTSLNTVEYSKTRLEHLRSNPLLFWGNVPNSDEIDRQLGITRLQGTETHLQCLDFEGAIVTNFKPKCVNFRGSKFHRVVFVRCEFSRCNFSYTDLSATAFVDCIFRGEQTIFVGAKTSAKTRFRNCVAESYKSWKMTGPDEFAEQMQARGLDVQPNMFF